MNYIIYSIVAVAIFIGIHPTEEVATESELHIQALLILIILLLSALVHIALRGFTITRK